MQLILRVTTRCNFDCTFCSASNLSNAREMTADDVCRYIDQYKQYPLDIVFEGGDPLLKSPSFYHQIFDYVQTNNINVIQYGFTTNLWDFYKHPHKWVDIFKRDDVSVCTSFQYGDQRRLTKDIVYDESLFIDVYNKFKQLINKPLTFIAVCNEQNDQYVLDTVRLAKKLNTFCKINPQFAAGKADTFYRFDKMLAKYRDIIINDLSYYEDNSNTIVQLVLNHYSDGFNCPFNRNCQNGIVCITPDGVRSNCSIENSTNLDSSIIKFYTKTNETNITKDYTKTLINSKCLTCEYFDWCNCCRVHIGEIKQLDNKQFDEYCDNIKRIIDEIIQYVQRNRYTIDKTM